MQTAMASAVLELAPGRLYALGGELEVSGRTSWLAPDARGLQRQSVYLMLDDGEAILLDCGPTVLRAPIIEQLVGLLPAGQELTIVLTRSEFETTGNLGAIAENVPVRAIYAAGGTSNPFDGFQLAADPARGPRSDHGGKLAKIGLTRVKQGNSLPLGEKRALHAITAPVRMLAAAWFYDTGTRTLFPTDFFGYTVSDPNISVEDGYRNLAARYWWLPGARTRRLVEHVDAVFDEFDVETIAPTHGCLFRGKAEVERQLRKVRAMLAYASTMPATT